MDSSKWLEGRADARRTRSDDAGLPRYSYSRVSIASQAAELVEHTHKLEDSRRRPWVWLKVKSRARDAKSWPLYYERDVINGIVEVDFDKTDGAKAVSITMLAGVTAVGQEETNFLTQTKDLWDSKTSGKAPSGRMAWTFTLALPSETLAADRPKAKAESYRLPPTFSERASPAYIDYKLVVTVRRGAFKVNQILTTSFFYTPLTRAEPPSLLRQTAYVDGSTLIGPDGDPQGWKILSSVHIKGTLFKTRAVDVECSLAVANPLSYAIGSPIPLFVTFSSDDEQALDIICAPTAVRVCLVRERVLGSHATRPDEPSPGNSGNVFREVMGGANFWPSTEGASEPHRRKLQGELDLRKALRPSFTFPNFALRYDVCLYPSQAPGFVHASPDSALITERVVINTLNAVGVIPRSYAPPGYSHPTEGNYNNVAGFLENGNQRFYHHGGFA